VLTEANERTAMLELGVRLIVFDAPQMHCFAQPDSGVELVLIWISNILAWSRNVRDKAEIYATVAEQLRTNDIKSWSHV
jgi:hypothetical protein